MTVNKNKGGRPLKFKSPEELEAKIEEYYQWANDNKKHITVSGLAWYLDINRHTLLNYENSLDNDSLKSVDDEVKLKFIATIKRAKARIEMECEEGLYHKESVVGTIFALKNNYNYVDKQEIVQESKNIEVRLED